MFIVFLDNQLTIIWSCCTNGQTWHPADRFTFWWESCFNQPRAASNRFNPMTSSVLPNTEIVIYSTTNSEHQQPIAFGFFVVFSDHSVWLRTIRDVATSELSVAHSYGCIWLLQCHAVHCGAGFNFQLEIVRACQSTFWSFWLLLRCT